MSDQKRASFVNPFTDFGFKKIFGEPQSIISLKGFLNTLLPEEHQIESLEFQKNEAMSRAIDDRKAVFDLRCVSEKGTIFLVELQKQKQNYFRDRSLYYSSFPIQEQAKRGEWNFKLMPVYCIGILDFCFDDYQEEEEEKGDVIHHVQLKNQHNRVFSDKLNFIYLEVPNFKKKLEELTNLQEMWLYTLRHLQDLNEIPHSFIGEEELKTAFENASLPQLTSEEHDAYQGSLKAYRDMKNILDTASDEAREEGKQEGKAEGMQEGMKRGRQEGLEEGMEKGMEKGIEKGLTEALNRLVENGISLEEAKRILG